MGEMVPVGHSLSDWDYPPGSIILSDLRWTSSPTSMRAFTDRVGGFTWVFLKPALGACIPEGKLTTEWYPLQTGLAYPRLVFRAQAWPPYEWPWYSWPANCYEVELSPLPDRSVLVTINRIVDKVRTIIHTWEGESDWITHSWYEVGVIWYNYTDEAGVPWMRIMVMRKLFGAWYEMTHFDEPNPLWSASPVNLVGLELWGWDFLDGLYPHVDDTRIYRRTP